MIEITLRPSEVQRAADCMLAWACNSSFAEHIEAAGYELHDTPLHISAPIGTGVHAGCEHGARGKMIARPALLQDCIDAGVSAYEAEIEKHGGYANTKWDATSRPQDAPKQIARMVRAWVEIRLPHVEPVEIERRRTITLHRNGNLIIRLSGQLDLGLDLPGEIRDWKTTDAPAQVQQGCYSLLREHVTGKPVEALGIEYIPRLPMSKEQTAPRLWYYDADACVVAAKQTLTRLIAAIRDFFERAYEKLRAFETNTRSGLCSRTWCGAHGTDACPISRLRIAA